MYLNTLKELWTSVSSRSITKHFLCISWCLIAGSKYDDCNGSWFKGGVKLLSALVFPPWAVLGDSKLPGSDLFLGFPKQQNNVRQMPRSFFIRTWLPWKIK